MPYQRADEAKLASADRALFSKARGKKMRQVSASMRERGTHRSDQGEVWADIAQKQASFCVNSATDAMGDVYEKEKARLDEYVNAIEPLPRQCGAVFAVDGKVAGIELFDCPATYARYLPKIVRSYAMDAAETRQPAFLMMARTPGGFVKTGAEDGMEVTAWQAGVTAPGMPWGRREA